MSGSNVVQLDQPKNGDTTFMQCGCTSEGVDFLVVVIVGDSPLVCGLLCPECETQLSVENGFVIEGARRR